MRCSFGKGIIGMPATTGWSAMEPLEVDLHWASFHVRHAKQLVDAHRAKIAQIRELGASTVNAEELLGVLLAFQEQLEKHLARVAEFNEKRLSNKIES